MVDDGRPFATGAEYLEEAAHLGCDSLPGPAEVRAGVDLRWVLLEVGPHGSGEGLAEARRDVHLDDPRGDGSCQICVGHAGGAVQHERYGNPQAELSDEFEVQPGVLREHGV